MVKIKTLEERRTEYGNVVHEHLGALNELVERTTQFRDCMETEAMTTAAWPTLTDADRMVFDEHYMHRQNGMYRLTTSLSLAAQRVQDMNVCVHIAADSLRDAVVAEARRNGQPPPEAATAAGSFHTLECQAKGDKCSCMFMHDAYV